MVAGKTRSRGRQAQTFVSCSSPSTSLPCVLAALRISFSEACLFGCFFLSFPLSFPRKCAGKEKKDKKRSPSREQMGENHASTPDTKAGAEWRWPSGDTGTAHSGELAHQPHGRRLAHHHAFSQAAGAGRAAGHDLEAMALPSRACGRTLNSVAGASRATTLSLQLRAQGALQDVFWGRRRTPTRARRRTLYPQQHSWHLARHHAFLPAAGAGCAAGLHLGAQAHAHTGKLAHPQQHVVVVAL